MAAALLAAGCFGDGPVGFVPGGAFSGELERGAEPDWSFAAPLDTVDVQIDSSPVRTVRTGIVVHEGIPYLPVTFAPLKRWPAVLRRSPRVVLRAEGRLFERTAVPVSEPALHAALIAAGQAKYGAPFHARWAAGMTHYFRLEPASPPAPPRSSAFPAAPRPAG